MLSLILNGSTYVNDNSITEGGVQLLDAPKPINSQGWWRGKFSSFWRLATRGESGFMSKGELAPADQWARVFINKGEFQRYIDEEAATCTITQLVLTDMVV